MRRIGTLGGWALPACAAARMGRCIRCCLLGAAGALAFANPAWGGEEPPASSLDLMRLPLEQLLELRVSGASQFEQKISDAPSAVVVLTAADMRNFHWRTLADALASLPGLYVAYDRNYAYLGARGFLRPGDYDSRFLLLVDGNRLNDSVYDEATIGSEFILDVDMIERIEYVPGPGSAIYGPNAFFGVINVVTRKGSQIGGAEAALEVGSFGERKGRASYGWHGAGGADAVVSATVYDNPGRDWYYPEFDTPQQNHGVAQGLDYDRAQQYLAQASYDGFSLTAAHSSRTKGIPTASYGQLFDDARSQTVDTQGFVDLAYSGSLAPRLQLSAHAFWNRYDYLGDYVYSADPPPATLQNIDGSHALWYGAGAHLVSSAFSGQNLVLGADLLRDASRNQYNYDLAPYLLHLDDRRSDTRYGVYAEDEIGLGHGLLLNLGARFDSDYAGAGHFNPRTALIWKAADATTAKLIYGTAYRAPNAYELYYNPAPPGVSGAGPGLGAERIRTYELVLEQGLSGAGLLTASLYHYDIHGLISQSVDQASGMPYFSNLDRVGANGAELAYQQQWSDGANLRASYAWQLARDPRSGAVLENSPRHLVKLNLSLPLVGERLRAGAEVQAASAQRGDIDRVGGYALANLTLLAPRVLPHIDAALTAYNLFDRHYAQPGGDTLTQNAIEQDGRTLLFKLTFAY